MNKQNIPAPETVSERNYGIDLLKIVAMLFICMLHVCNQGGVVASSKTYPDNYNMVMFLKALTYGALDMYAIISGYVGYNKKFKLSRPLRIWIELICYTLLSTHLITVFSPEILPENAWFKSFFPVMTREYWYMTAYFGMVILMPFLNAAIQKASMKIMSVSLAGVLLFYCALPNIMDVSVFGLGGGYSTLWLCVLYLVGGYLAKLKKKPHPLLSFGMFILMVLFTWLLKLKEYPSAFDYTAPTVMLGAVFMVLTFSQIKIKPRPLQKIISFVVPSTLGIFIIHVHTFFWDNFLKNCLKNFAKEQTLLLGLRIFAAALFIFVVCGAVDVIRRGLFWYINTVLLPKLDKFLEKLFADKKPKESEKLPAEAPADTPPANNQDNNKGPSA